MPHPIIPSPGLSKPLSRAMSLLITSDDVVVENWCLHEGQVPGGLRNFLVRPYANILEVEQAFAEAGGSVILRATFGTAPSVVGFRVDANGYPILILKGGKPPSGCEVRILLAESARA